MRNNEEQEIFSGLWRRAGAFIIDAIVLVAFATLLGFFFFYQFAALGPYGKLVGFCIAAVYFTFFNSSIGGGQTLGKRVLKIKVINKNGILLNPIISFLRFCILGVPILLGDLLFLNYNAYTPIGIFFKPILMIALPIVSIYLVIFNLRTQQTLHDLIAGSYVVHRNITQINERKYIWGGHLGVSLLILGVFLVLSLNNLHFLKTSQVQEELTVKSKIEKLTQSWKVSVLRGTIQRGSDQKNYYSAKFTIPAFDKDEVKTGFAKKGKDVMLAEVAHVILKNIPEAEQADFMSISVVYGFEIGISRMWVGSRQTYTLAEWKHRIKIYSTLD